MSNSFKLHPKHFSKGERKIFLPPLFTGMLTWGPIVLQSLHLTSQTKLFKSCQSRVLCTKERDDIGRQTKNVRAPVVFGLYFPSSQYLIKIFLKETTVNSQG